MANSQANGKAGRKLRVGFLNGTTETEARAFLFQSTLTWRHIRECERFFHRNWPEAYYGLSSGFDDSEDSAAPGCETGDPPFPPEGKAPTYPGARCPLREPYEHSDQLDLLGDTYEGPEVIDFDWRDMPVPF